MSKFFVHSTAEVSKDASIGDNTKIWHQAQVREGAEIGKNCVISKSVYIDFNVKIGDNCKIQNFVSVYNGITVEDDVFIGPSAALTNDLYPRAVNPGWKPVKTTIKKGASIGANATVVCGITIGEYATIGAGAVVVNDVNPHRLVVGNPAKEIGFVCKCGNRAKELCREKGEVTLSCPSCKSKLVVKE